MYQSNFLTNFCLLVCAPANQQTKSTTICNVHVHTIFKCEYWKCNKKFKWGLKVPEKHIINFLTNVDCLLAVYLQLAKYVSEYDKTL